MAEIRDGNLPYAKPDRLSPATGVAGAGTYTPDVRAYKTHRVQANGSTLTIAAPINAVVGQIIVIDLKNNSGGVITTTWNSVYKLAGAAWTEPANNKRRLVMFVCTTTSVFLEISRSSGDVDS